MLYLSIIQLAIAKNVSAILPLHGEMIAISYVYFFFERFSGDFVKSFSVIVHYNGSGFDIPFIIKKCDIYHIPCDFSGIESFDIYKNISMLKSLLKLENLKQKSIESFMSVTRDDKYSGGELIKVYEEYLKSADDSLLKLLLLHIQ